MSDITKLTYVVGAKRLQENNRDTEYLLSQEQLEMFANLVRVDECKRCIEDVKMCIPRSGHSTPEMAFAKKVIGRIEARGQA